jgi:hypothetical protein
VHELAGQLADQDNLIRPLPQNFLGLATYLEDENHLLAVMEAILMRTQSEAPPGFYGNLNEVDFDLETIIALRYLTRHSEAEPLIAIHPERMSYEAFDIDAPALRSMVQATMEEMLGDNQLRYGAAWSRLEPLIIREVETNLNGRIYAREEVQNIIEQSAHRVLEKVARERQYRELLRVYLVERQRSQELNEREVRRERLDRIIRQVRLNR